MTTVHLATPEKQQIQYTEDQFRTYFQQGAFHPDCLFWIEGMAEWRPIGEYAARIGNVAPPQPVQESPSYMEPLATPVQETPIYQQPNPVQETPIYPPTPQQYPNQQVSHPFGHQTATPYGYTGTSQATPMPFGVYRELAPMVYHFKTSLIIVAICYGISTLLLLLQFATGTNTTITIINGLVSLVMTPAFITVVVYYCRFFYRATTNVMFFGATDITHNPTFAAACNFIPIIAFWMPYQSVSEVYRASVSPQNWRNTPNSPVIRWWWFLWVSPWFVMPFFLTAVFMAVINNPGDTRAIETISYGYSAITSPLFVITTILLMKIINLIYQEQSRTLAVRMRKIS